MVLRKAPKKKKSKKSSKGRGNDWDLDGFSSQGSSEKASYVKGPRTTQNKDDRLRRMSRTISSRESKKKFREKMSQKVSFDDVFDEESDNSSPESNDEEAQPVVSRSYPVNPRCSFDRLYDIVKNNKSSFSSNAAADDNESVSSEVSESGHSEIMNENLTSDIPDNYSEGNDSSDEDLENNYDSMSSYDLLFSDLITVEPSSTEQKFKKLDSFDEFEIHSSPSISNVLNQAPVLPSLTYFGDIPGLPKLWKSRANTRVNSISSRLLPHLMTYKDALLDGRDHINDLSWLEMITFHICMHSIKARNRVLKHNQRIKERQHDLEVQQALLEASRNESEKSKKKDKKKKEITVADVQAGMNEDTLRDQGYTRARILILCPFRSSAYDIVKKIQAVLGSGTSISNWDKFEDEFGYVDDSSDEEEDDDEDEDDVSGDDVNDDNELDDENNEEEDEDDEDDDDDLVGKKRKTSSKAKKTISQTKKAKKSEQSRDNATSIEGNDLNNKKDKKKTASKKEKKNIILPDDWNAIFQRRNMDDDFKIGLQINPGKGKGSGSSKGVEVKLFTDFFMSDIIIASPLGLRLLIEKDLTIDDGSEFRQAKKIQHDGKFSTNQSSEWADFLSSLEIVYTHQTDVIYYQNFDHLSFVLQYCNVVPSKDHGTDFSRVRNYFLEGNSKFHRQLIVSTHFMEGEIQSLFRQFSTSMAGRLRLRKKWPEGSMLQVNSQIPQIFQRLPLCESLAGVSDARFSYFVEHVLSPILRMNQSRTLIVAPSYLDFVRIRNELMRRDVNACFISEYSRNSEITRGRARFFHGQVPIMLYSGRAHFFRRFHIRGAQHLVFYSLPEYEDFYSELVNFLEVSEDNQPWNSFGSQRNSISLFSSYDRFPLERIVGHTRSQHLLNGEKSTFMFQ